RPPGDSPYVPVGEIPDWNGDPASTYEDRHAQLEEDETEDVADVDEELRLASGTRETSEEQESLGDVFQDSVDKQTGQIHLSTQRVLGKEQRAIPPRLRYKNDRPPQTPKYKTVLTHRREKDN
ncbi:MAG: hypothetical protein NTU97_03135, partial [Candidatus Magasanikbacteria bacterium]|nr:hypothetical protein [Candidatus Magasanikbacteria bacterium]